MQKDNKELFNAVNTAATVSLYMISSVVAGVLLGRLADGYFGSQPWATVAGIVLGMIAGMYSIYKKVMGGK